MDITMSFDEALQQLETGVYGEDVREAIYTALQRLHDDGASAIGEGSIKTYMLDSRVVTNDKIAENTIDGLHKIAEKSITSSRLADDSIFARHIKNGEVTSAKLEEGLKNTINTITAQAGALYYPTKSSHIEVVEGTPVYGLTPIDYKIRDGVVSFAKLDTDLQNALSAIETMLENIDANGMQYAVMAADALDAQVAASDIQATYNLVNDLPVGINFQIKDGVISFANFDADLQNALNTIADVIEDGLATDEWNYAAVVANAITTALKDTSEINLTLEPYTPSSGLVTIQQGVFTIKNGIVTTAKIADSSITTNKIADGAIATTKIADEAVENGKIAPLSITEDKLATALQEKLFLGTSWVAVSRNKINPSAIVIENPDEEIPIEQQQEAAADALASAYPWRTSGGSAKFATRMDSDDGRGSLPLNPTTYAVWQTGKKIHGELQFTSEYDFTEGYRQGAIKCNEWLEEQKALAEEIERIKAQEYGYDVHTGCTVTVLNDGTDEHYADFSVDISAFTVHKYYLENGKSLALKAPTAGILAKNGDETSTSIANEYSANDLTWAIAYSYPDEAQADNYIIPLTRAQYEAAVAENDNIIDKAAKIAELEALVDPAYSNALSRLLKKTQIIAAIMTEMYGAAAMDNITETIMCQDGFNRKIVLLPKWRPSHLPLKDTCYTTIGGNITKFDGTHVPITGYINSNGTVAFYVDRVETKTEVDSTVFFNKLNLWFDYELA